MRQFLTFLLIMTLAWPVAAQQGDIGPVTSLPLPRFVSLKASKAHVRRGPAQTHRIDWVLNHRATPLQVTAEYGNWLRVVDADAAGGWVHRSLLSGVRTVVVIDDSILLFAAANADSQPLARLEKGVIAHLGACQIEWCEVETGGFSGWVLKIAVWGVGPTEIRE